ncbi:MAG: YadA C-terminal domain-containing protein, partial [Endozoicomonas sp. (ex Botrylloides leachii)]|nr:YadA C-terminal domain-containing protein [Endozoicomonas sp. (ex Botrylloides leachii)]
DAHDKHFTKNDGRLDAHDKHFTKNDGRLDAHDKHFTKNDGRLDAHDKHFTKNDGRLDAHDKHFTKNDGRLNQHDKVIASNKTNIAANAKGLQNEMNLRAKYDQQIRSDMTRNFAQVRNVIDHNNKIALGGIAQAMAQSVLPQAYQGESLVSIGTGYFRGENAMALGFSKNFGRDHKYTVKASVSVSAFDTAASVGLGYKL